MQADTDTAPRQGRPLSVNKIGAVAAIAALVVMVAVAVHREARTPANVAGTAAPATPMTERTSERPPMTAAEEAFATALWAIHSQVRQDAVRMTYAGLSYKMHDIDGRELKARIEPLAKSFDASAKRVEQIEVPAALTSMRDRYAGAVKRYAEAARIMLRTDAQGDAALIKAQELSQQSSEDLLRVSDVLWPGEHKPN